MSGQKGDGLSLSEDTEYMSDHISTSQMEVFCAHAAEISEQTTIAEHLAACAQCRRLLHEIRRGRRDSAPVAFDLSAETWLKHEHLEYEQLVPYVEGGLDETDREIIDLHLNSCRQCREVLQSFLNFRQEVEPEMQVRYFPREQTVQSESRNHLWQRFVAGWRPIYEAAAVVVIAGTIFIAGVLFRQHRTDEQQARQTQTNIKDIVSPRSYPAITQPPSAPPAPLINETESASNSAPSTRADAATKQAQPPVRRAGTLPRNSAASRSVSPEGEVIALVDGRDEITLTASGDVTGLKNAPPESARAVREVLLAQDITRPEGLPEIVGEPAALRGAASGETSSYLMSPARTVIVDDRPAFKWKPRTGATSYRVHVVDASNRAVARSEELPSAITGWTPTNPLKRGEVYTWVLVATVNGEEVTIPPISEPEMKFKVLEAEKLGELDKLKDSGSHLALGIFYARSGMLAEAESEFQKLAEQNPHSPLAMRLLRRVRSWR